MPTIPSQGDVLQSRYGTHGDIYPIVFAPNSVAELYSHTIHAFNAAEQSKTPVILLSDAILSHMHESVEFKQPAIINREPTNFGSTKKHITGLLSKENTPVTKDSEYYKVWFNEYKKQIQDMAKNYEFFEYLENSNTDTLLIAFGATSRTILPLKEKYSIFRPIRLFPILPQIKETAEKYKRVIVVEMNDGQYASELQKILGDKIKSISLLGGKISLEEIKQRISEND
jgi:2-oxoglutarate ferredoxin oxidoreductase subunit alpha